MGFVLSLLVARVKFEAWVKFESRVRFESGPKFFFLVFFFFDYTNAVRVVTRNINFPVVDIFHSRSILDGEGSGSQEYLTFAPEKINTIDSIPSPVSINKDCGLRTTEYGVRTGLDIKHGLQHKTRTKHYGLGIKYELGIKHGLVYEQAHTGSKLHCLLSVSRAKATSLTCYVTCKLLICGLGPESSLYPFSVLHA